MAHRHGGQQLVGADVLGVLDVQLRLLAIGEGEVRGADIDAVDPRDIEDALDVLDRLREFADRLQDEDVAGQGQDGGQDDDRGGSWGSGGGSSSSWSSSSSSFSSSGSSGGGSSGGGMGGGRGR